MKAPIGYIRSKDSTVAPIKSNTFYYVEEVEVDANGLPHFPLLVTEYNSEYKIQIDFCDLENFRIEDVIGIYVKCSYAFINKLKGLKNVE